MKFAKEISIILGITLLGELLNALLPFPVPSGVYGLFLLLFCLCAGIVKVDQIEETGNFLLETMPMMFIPVSVGLLENYDAIKAILIPFLVITLLSTIIVMAVTGKTAEFMVAKKQKKGDYDERGI